MAAENETVELHDPAPVFQRLNEKVIPFLVLHSNRVD
jgi:hypothetical protein